MNDHVFIVLHFVLLRYGKVVFLTVKMWLKCYNLNALVLVFFPLYLNLKEKPQCIVDTDKYLRNGVTLFPTCDHITCCGLEGIRGEGC